MQFLFLLWSELEGVKITESLTSRKGEGEKEKEKEREIIHKNKRLLFLLWKGLASDFNYF